MPKISKAELKEIESLVGTPSRDLALGGYDGAALFDKQVAGWQPAIRSGDAEVLPAKERLDARARDLQRNDAYVQGGSNIHKDSIVGAFFMLNAKPAWLTLGKDEEWAERFQTEVEEKFTLWAESPMKWVDAARQNDFTSLIRLAVGVYTFTGEALATAEWLRSGGREFATAVQMVDTDRLSTPPQQEWNTMIRGGIKVDRFGAPVSAFIRTRHPNEHAYGWNMAMAEPFWKEVPFEKPWGRRMVMFMREQSRVDQSRNVSDLAAGLREIAITRKFRDVTLQKAVLAASYAATIESELPPSVVYEQLGAAASGTANTAVIDYGAQFLNALNAYVGSSKNLLIDGVKIPHLFPGTKLNMQSVGDPAGVGQGFEQSLLRYIAAALNVSYEELSKDYTKTNYSSARAAMSNTFKFMQGRKRAVADAFATAIYRLWLEEAVNQNKLESFPASEAPKLYVNGYLSTGFDALSQCSWIGAARGQIDELKETQAAVLRIKYGLSTHEDELARLGKDWRKVYQQLEREKKERDARNIVLADDPNMMNAAGGDVRDSNTTEDAGNADSEDPDA